MAGALINWRARRIADPVARLRFLRQTLGDRSWLTLAPHGRSRKWLRERRRMVYLSMVGLLLLPAGQWGSRLVEWSSREPVLVAEVKPAPDPPAGNVWLAEQQAEHESWSNGLRIERRYETVNEGREFQSYPIAREAPETGETGKAPVGIVFHTTESHQADYAEDNIARLKLIGEALLRYVQENKSYHYLVDRFGRVWRVVREADTANHAGYSVWADERRTYVNLNRSFLGVSVEGQSRPENGGSAATPAQVHALRLLTEMLRSKYGIRAVNCVTHAQVSVNPSNLRIGYHTDWAAGFPYAEIGLPDNYSRPVAALWLFGFNYDPQLVKATGAGYWKGLILAEEQLRLNATANGLEPARWRRKLQSRYKEVLRDLQERYQSGPAAAE